MNHIEFAPQMGLMAKELVIIVTDNEYHLHFATRSISGEWHSTSARAKGWKEIIHNWIWMDQFPECKVWVKVR